MRSEDILSGAKIKWVSTGNGLSDATVEMPDEVFERKVDEVQDANPDWTRERCTQRFSKVLADAVINIVGGYPTPETVISLSKEEVPHEPAP